MTRNTDTDRLKQKVLGKFAQGHTGKCSKLNER